MTTKTPWCMPVKNWKDVEFCATRDVWEAGNMLKSKTIVAATMLATPSNSAGAVAANLTQRVLSFVGRTFNAMPAAMGLVFGLLLFISVRAEAVPIQGPVLTNGEQHYYDIIDGQFTWTGANVDAANQSYLGFAGHLMTIESAAENTVANNLRVLCSTSTPGNCAAWIGLTDAAQEGTFVWVTGEPLAYTNWFPGEPNNQHGTENYVVIASGALWNDLPNNGSAGTFA